MTERREKKNKKKNREKEKEKTRYGGGKTTEGNKEETYQDWIK